MTGNGKARTRDGRACARPKALGRGWFLCALLVFAVAMAACASGPPAISGPLPTIEVQPPVDTAYAWFAAINDNDYPLALAHFVPADRSYMEWSSFGSVSFSDVTCNLISQASNAATVGCFFTVQNPPPDMQDDTGWSIDMERHTPGPWLIVDYGVG